MNLKINRRLSVILLSLLLLLTTACAVSKEAPMDTPEATEEMTTSLDTTDSDKDSTDLDSEESSDTEDTTMDSETTTDEPVQEILEPVTWIPFINEDKNFSLEYPSNWIIVDKDRYGVLLRPVEGTQTSFYVDVHTSSYGDATNASLVEEMIDDVLRIRSDATFEDLVSIEIGGYPFMQLNYQGVSSDETTYFYQAYFAALDLGYEMYFAIPEPEMEAYHADMEKIAESFKFLSQ